MDGGWWLLTGESGRFEVLEDADFRRFVEGKVADAEPLGRRLAAAGFLRDRLDFPALARGWRERTAFQRHPGPTLHEFVVTLRCNLACHYCHSSVVDPARTDVDMSLETARKSVDFMFSTPSPTLALEFQGGEPLLNWPVVRFATEYARARAAREGRRLVVSLVSNLSLLTEERLSFLLENYVAVCTSLDGPPQVHDRNRPLLGGGPSQAQVVRWLKDVRARAERGAGGKRYYLPGALLTTTRHSLPHAEAIVDLYEEMGLGSVFVRKLSPIGYARRAWPELGYSPEEFVAFYGRCLERVLHHARRGSPLTERWAVTVLTKALRNADPGYMDLRSPTGGVLGCLAYGYDGRLFSSDEARMLDQEGDPLFQVGTVDGTWGEVLDSAAARAVIHASLLDNQPMCDRCAYKPWCGLDPVYNYAAQGTLFGRVPESAWCRMYMGAFDAVMQKLRVPDDRRILEEWLKRSEGPVGGGGEDPGGR